MLTLPPLARPVPAVKSMEPDAPPTLLPDASAMAPELPEVAVPDDKSTLPLDEDAAVDTLTAPLAAPELPDLMTTRPPARPDARPPKRRNSPAACLLAPGCRITWPLLDAAEEPLPIST